MKFTLQSISFKVCQGSRKLLKKFNFAEFLIQHFKELQNPEAKEEAHVAARERQHREKIKVDIADSSGGDMLVQVDYYLQAPAIRSRHWKKTKTMRARRLRIFLHLTQFGGCENSPAGSTSY